MKGLKLLLIFFLINCFHVTVVSAQKQLAEATLVYNISVESTNEKKDLAKSLEGAMLTVYIKGNQSRSEMSSVVGSESSLYDKGTGKGYILKEYSGQKLMITMNKENWAQKNQYYQNLNFTITPGEETINGFVCKKATATLPNGNTFYVYFTPETTLVNKNYNNAFMQLQGIPVQFELESGNLRFKYVLHTINTDPIPQNKFDIPKTGYRVMSYEDNQQLKRGDKK